MKTILVPTDFSIPAANAAAYAAHLAIGMGANLLLVHVYHVPIPMVDNPAVIFTPEYLQGNYEGALRKEAQRLNELTGVVVNCKAKMGFALEEILQEENISMIVMGLKGIGKLSEVLIGSVSTAVVRKSKVPVWIIPEEATFTTPEKIVLASDYDPRTNEHTLDALKGIAKKFNAEIYIVNVKPKKEAVSVEEAIAGVRLENKLEGVKHVYYFQESEDTIDGINRVVADLKADVIAMIPHRYNLIDRLFHRSISKQIAFHTQVPLLALPDNHMSIPAFLL